MNYINFVMIYKLMIHMLFFFNNNS